MLQRRAQFLTRSRGRSRVATSHKRRAKVHFAGIDTTWKRLQLLSRRAEVRPRLICRDTFSRVRAAYSPNDHHPVEPAVSRCSPLRAGVRVLVRGRGDSSTPTCFSIGDFGRKRIRPHKWGMETCQQPARRTAANDELWTPSRELQRTERCAVMAEGVRWKHLPQPENSWFRCSRRCAIRRW